MINTEICLEVGTAMDSGDSNPKGCNLIFMCSSALSLTALH